MGRVLQLVEVSAGCIVLAVVVWLAGVYFSERRPQPAGAAPRPPVRAGPAAGRSEARPAAAVPSRPLSDGERRLLADALGAEDYATRIVATETLSRVDRATALAGLRRQLGDPEPTVRAAAIRALGERAFVESRALLESVRDDESELLWLRSLALRSLLTPNP